MLTLFTKKSKAAYGERRANKTTRRDPTRQPLFIEYLPSPKLSQIPSPNAAQTPRSVQSNESEKRNRFSYTEEEINLVMYYLDHNFPRFCPFFEYTPTNDGRGWLLNLFLRTKPLCSLAVCIAACDKAQLVLGPLNETPQTHLDLEMQHIQIVADLRDHLHRLAESENAEKMSTTVEALACIMHLILFEVSCFETSTFSKVM